RVREPCDEDARLGPSMFGRRGRALLHRRTGSAGSEIGLFFLKVAWRPAGGRKDRLESFSMTETLPKPIRAAGGIVRGAGQNTGKLLVVRRRRYGGEVGLPKGKLVEGEDEAAAALREVEEETGLRPVLRQHVGRTHYKVRGRPKTVSYFVMDAIDDNVAR